MEDVRFNHYRKNWGSSFSTVEIGKQRVREWMQVRGRLSEYKGHKTAELRKEMGLKKTKKKSEQRPESHAVDAIAMAADRLATIDIQWPEFYVWSPTWVNYRRSLHVQNFQKGHKRRRQGGTSSYGIQKNTLVRWRGGLYLTGGNTKNRISLHECTQKQKRVTQDAKLSDIHIIAKARTWFSRLLPRPKGRGFRREGVC